MSLQTGMDPIPGAVPGADLPLDDDAMHDRRYDDVDPGLIRLLAGALTVFAVVYCLLLGWAALRHSALDTEDGHSLFEEDVASDDDDTHPDNLVYARADDGSWPAVSMEVRGR